MNKTIISTFVSCLFLATLGISAFAQNNTSVDEIFVSYIVDTRQQDIEFYWKDNNEENFRSIQNLKKWLEKNHKTLVFAMNGGMYKPDNSPQGLFIYKGKTLASIDTISGSGNFYLKPNGIFYITTNDSPVISTTVNFDGNSKIKFATQSGPMLVIDGQLHPAFKEGSTNLNIRNGVGILPNNKVIFAMSKKEINFYDFASFFKKLGCKNALYLDGLVSRTYLPEDGWKQVDGNFGVIIGVTVTKN